MIQNAPPWPDISENAAKSYGCASDAKNTTL
jgi:hypothetical protein